MRTVVFTTALLALISGVAAQPASRPPPFPEHIWSMIMAGLASSDPHALSASDGAGQFLAMSGREELVTAERFFVRRVCEPLMRDGSPVEPVTYIAAAARDARIVMIGESHANPLTRHFIGRLAAGLHPLGYGVYAAETFSDRIATQEPALPLLSDGAYTRDPIYGRVVRGLRKLDYRLVPYEDMGSASSNLPFDQRQLKRHATQAANLAAHVRREASKVLVHAGEGNHMEYPRPGGRPYMGAAFKESSGIDPLSIEQTAYESPTGDFIVCDPAAFAAQPSGVDIHIGVPQLTYERGRPTWRRQLGDRFAEIPAALHRSGQIAIYEARIAGEPATVTPMDRLLLRPGESLPLLLPPGRYDLSVWTEKDGWSDASPLTVPQ